MPRKSKGPWFRKGRGWYVEEDDRQIFLSKDKGEAMDAWHRHQIGEPIVPTAGDPTFSEVMEAYCTEIERTRTARHLRGTHWRLNQLCEHWRNRPVGSLRLADVTKALAAHAWGPTTQANVLTALRGMLKWASMPGGMIKENPLPVLKLPRAKTRVNTMSAAQLAALLAAAPQPLVMILWALMETGARPSELIRAKASDCDQDGSAIRLATGKQGRRVIFFPAYARPIMAKLRKDHFDGPLFRQPNGTGWSEYWFFNLTRKARKAAKLPPWATAYVLRHSWITNRLREGVPIATVARMAGTSVTMIDRVYGHLADQDLRAVADGMS